MKKKRRGKRETREIERKRRGRRAIERENVSFNQCYAKKFFWCLCYVFKNVFTFEKVLVRKRNRPTFRCAFR